MRKGRGLIDQEVFDELVKIPGAREIVIQSVTNHRYDSKTDKVRVEIHEDDWPEVKQMVQNFKRLKAGKPQLPFQKKQKSVAKPVIEDKQTRNKFRKGQVVMHELVGPGNLVSGEKATILRVTRKEVWLDNGAGNDPSGPFDHQTGWHQDEVFGTRQRIKLLSEKRS